MARKREEPSTMHDNTEMFLRAKANSFTENARLARKQVRMGLEADEISHITADMIRKDAVRAIEQAKYWTAMADAYVPKY